MKAIRLTPNHDSQTVQVEAVELATAPDCDEPSLESLYSNLDCNQVQMVYCSERGTLKNYVAFVDEDALFNDNKGFIFCPQIGAQPYAGRILLMKSDGFSVTDADLDVEVMRKLPGLVYANPRFAAHAMRKHEDEIRAANPGVIGLDAASLIFDRLAP